MSPSDPRGTDVSERDRGQGQGRRAVGGLDVSESGRDRNRREGRRAAVLGQRPHYGRYVGLLGLVILVLITINTVLTKPNGSRGIEPGHPVPPFAAPLALGRLSGDVNIARHADEGSAGKVPACAVRGPGVLNMCESYERGPVVLALFVDGGSCPDVLDRMQALAGQFAGVSFAGVAIKGERGALRKLIAKRGLTRVQVGFDSDGVLAGLYKLGSCPQVSFVLPGGIVQSPALLVTPSRAALRARVEGLLAAARARGWRQP